MGVYLNLMQRVDAADKVVFDLNDAIFIVFKRFEQVFESLVKSVVPRQRFQLIFEVLVLLQFLIRSRNQIGNVFTGNGNPLIVDEKEGGKRRGDFFIAISADERLNGAREL